jgi:hypothetical protein
MRIRCSGPRIPLLGMVARADTVLDCFSFREGGIWCEAIFWDLRFQLLAWFYPRGFRFMQAMF